MFNSLELAVPLGPALITLFGQQRRLIEDNGIEASKLAVALGASPSKIARVIVASDETQPGFQQVVTPDYQEMQRGDAIILCEPKSASIMQSGDCPIAIFHNQLNGLVLKAHCGRPAMTPFCKEKSPNCDFTIIENALQAVTKGGDKSGVEVVVLGSICPEHFRHEQPDAREKVRAFEPLGDHVFRNKDFFELDLFSVIKHRLIHGGVPTENIQLVGPCTYESPRLSSHRRGDKDTRNTVIVTMR